MASPDHNYQMLGVMNPGSFQIYYWSLHTYDDYVINLYVHINHR